MKAAAMARDSTLPVETPPEIPKSLGEVCLEKGLVAKKDLEECLRIQRELEQAGKPVPRLGELLVQKGLLTARQVGEALGEQKMEIRYCPRCQIRVNVPIRSDAAWYRCGRCQGPLVPAPESAGVGAVDDSIIIVSREPLPPEVERRKADPEARFGKYILLRELGRGGVGVVYQAWDTYLSQYVALKRIKPLGSVDPTAHESRVISLFKEGRNLIRLRHPSIVAIFDVGRINREFYISMEYLEGETLAQWVVASRERGSLSPYSESPRRVLRILRDVARAVHFAHTRPSPIVHCDLKPANILINQQGHSYVLDFGLARNLKVERGGEGQISGTPSYMAPEQASGHLEDIDARTDVYAFGAILYEILTGRPPFVGTLHQVLERVIGQPPEFPSRLIAPIEGKGDTSRRFLRVPEELEEICMRCLEKERSSRPQSMDEVARALDHAFTPRTRSMPGTPPPVPLPPPASAPPPSPAAADTTIHAAPVPPSPRRRLPSPGVLGWVAAGFLAAAIPLLYLLVRPFGDRGAAPTREQEVAARIAEFQPDLALASARDLLAETRGGPREGIAVLLVEEATWVAGLRERLALRLSGRVTKCPELRLRELTLRPVEITDADETGLAVSADGRETKVSWKEIEPSQIDSLARDALGPLDPADRLSLAIFSLHANRKVEARTLFDSLRGTAMAPLADRYLFLTEARP